MTTESWLRRLARQEHLNFLLTNRIPHGLANRFIAWFSQIEIPAVRWLSIRIWSLFSDLDLSEARKQTFHSLHDCFVRELKAGARPIDMTPGTLVSPCDGIVGACGKVEDGRLYQAKGSAYDLGELFAGSNLADHYRNGTYVTLRLTSTMYHRFHAPARGKVESVQYISGCTWNVNPIALARIERLYCQNERALIPLQVDGTESIVTLVPVAAILVASIRLHCIDVLLHLRYRGPGLIPCHAELERGQEMGWFQHGSTILVFAPSGYEMCEGVVTGQRIRMGERLMSGPAEVCLHDHTSARSETFDESS